MKSLRSSLFSNSGLPGASWKDEICRLPYHYQAARGSHKVSSGNSKIVKSSKLLVRKIKRKSPKFLKISTHSIGRKQDSGNIPKNLLLISNIQCLNKSKNKLDELGKEPLIESIPTYIFSNISLPTFSNSESSFGVYNERADWKKRNSDGVLVLSRDEDNTSYRNSLLDIIENPKNCRQIVEKSEEDDLFDAEDAVLGSTPSDSVWKALSMPTSYGYLKSNPHRVTTTFVASRPKNLHDDKIEEENFSVLNLHPNKTSFDQNLNKIKAPTVLDMFNTDTPPQTKDDKIEILSNYLKDKLDNLFLQTDLENCQVNSRAQNELDDDIVIQMDDRTPMSCPQDSRATQDSFILSEESKDFEEDSKKMPLEKPLTTSDPTSILNIINSVDKSAVIIQKDLYITNKILDSIKKKQKEEKDAKIEALTNLLKDNLLVLPEKGILSSVPASKNVSVNNSRQTHDGPKSPHEPQLNVDMSTKTVITSSSKGNGSEISVVEIQKFTDNRLPFPFTTETVLQVFGTKDKLKDAIGVVEQSKAKLALMSDPINDVDPTFQNMLTTMKPSGPDKKESVSIRIPVEKSNEKQDNAPSHEDLMREAKHDELVRMAQTITANNKAMRLNFGNKSKRIVIRRNRNKMKKNQLKSEEKKPFKENVERVKIIGPKDLDLILGTVPKGSLENRNVFNPPVKNPSPVIPNKETTPPKEEKPFFKHLPAPSKDPKMSNVQKLKNSQNKSAELEQDENDGLSLRDKRILKNIIFGKHTRDFSNKNATEVAPTSTEKEDAHRPTEDDKISKEMIENVKKESRELSIANRMKKGQLNSSETPKPINPEPEITLDLPEQKKMLSNLAPQEKIEPDNLDASKVDNLDASKVDNLDASKVDNHDASKVDNHDASKVDNLDASKVDNHDASKVDNLDVCKVDNIDASKVGNLDASKVDIPSNKKEVGNEKQSPPPIKQIAVDTQDKTEVNKNMETIKPPEEFKCENSLAAEVPDKDESETSKVSEPPKKEAREKQELITKIKTTPVPPQTRESETSKVSEPPKTEACERHQIITKIKTTRDPPPKSFTIEDIKERALLNFKTAKQREEKADALVKQEMTDEVNTKTENTQTPQPNFDPQTSSNQISRFLFNFDKLSKEMTPVLDTTVSPGCAIPEHRILEFPMLNPAKVKYVAKPSIISMDVNNNLILKKQLKGIPSVTTILNATMSDSSKAALSRWRTTMINQLGEVGFRDFYKEQLKKGSDFHGSVHQYLKGSETRYEDESNLTFQSVKEVLKNVTDVSVLESHVVHSQLGYRGIVDCVARYKGVPVVIEWKRSDKPKPTVRHTFDAPIQLCAYLGALNYDKTYDIQVEGALVVVAYSDGTKADVFTVGLDECAVYWKEWLNRFKTYILANQGFPLNPLS